MSDPIKTLSELSKSSIAVPSAKNSGFDRTSNLLLLEFDFNIVLIAAAVLTGRVDFSTTISSSTATLEILTSC